MLPIRSRAAGIAAALSLSLAVAAGAPVTAADDPEAAAQALLDAVEAGAYEDLESLICEAEREVVIEALDPGEAMGFDGARDLLTFAYEDVGIELVSEDGDSATVKVTGTMSMETGDMPIEDVARALLEADMEEVSDEDLEMMLPFLEMALTQTMPLDSELTVVKEDGEWVVCGGLGEAPQDEVDFEDDFTVTQPAAEGVCALATPEELTAAGQLEYLDSSGWELTTCTFSNWETGHSTNVVVELDADVAYAANAYGYDTEVDVAGAPAFTADQENSQMLVQAGPDVLNVQVWPPQETPEGYDWIEQTAAVAEIFVPRVIESRESLIAPVKPLLCDLGFAADYEAAIGLPIQSGNVSSDACNFDSTDSMRVRVYVSEGQLDDSLMFYPDAEETTLAGLPALEMSDTFTEGSVNFRVQLPGDQVLDMTVEPYSYDRPMSVSGAEVAELLTEHIVDKLPE